MSKKIVDFGEETILFNQKTSCLWDVGFSGSNIEQRGNELYLPDQFPTAQANEFEPTSREAFLTNFCISKIVAQYSARDLTNPEDKLTALAGMAQFVIEELAEDFTKGVKYVAGLWDKICWKTEYSVLAKRN